MSRPPLTPSPLESLLVRVAGEVSSQTLKLDPASHPRLQALAGTRIRFEVLPPDLPGLPGVAREPRTLLLSVEPDALQLEAGSDAEAHAVVSGTLPDIARSFFGSAAESDKPTNETLLRIDGDEAALQAVATLFRELEPDLAEPLSKVLGREAADNLIGAAEAGLAFLRSAAESLASGARQEATKAWVSDQAQSALMDRLDDLRLRVDRLDARVSLAESRPASAEPQRSGQ